jgi:hypothetical protein
MRISTTTFLAAGILAGSAALTAPALAQMGPPIEPSANRVGEAEYAPCNHCNASAALPTLHQLGRHQAWTMR